MQIGKYAYIVLLEVATLDHEVLDDPVEGAALVAETFLTCSPRPQTKCPNEQQQKVSS